ncbi:hypothetical protein QUF55_00200 [Clostridiaceae bacterium HSG29]|nr:hypothetical protein [Clostridiaceae bacterium HSG29]
MSIRPIDMQTMLPKLQSLKFAKELEINKHDNDMNDLNKEMKESSIKKANKVLNAERKETDKLKNDTSKKNNKNKKHMKKNEEKNEEKNENKKKKIYRTEGNRFDMKV